MTIVEGGGEFLQSEDGPRPVTFHYFTSELLGPRFSLHLYFLFSYAALDSLVLFFSVFVGPSPGSQFSAVHFSPLFRPFPTSFLASF